MKRFKYIYMALLLGLAFSCKAPSTNNTGNDSSNIDSSAGVPEVDMPNNLDLISTWWVEKNYANKTGSPTVVYLDTKTHEVFTRTQSGVALTKVGTFSTSGGKITVTDPGITFYVDENGNWDRTVLFNGKKLVEGRFDFTSGELVDNQALFNGMYKGYGKLFQGNGNQHDIVYTALVNTSLKQVYLGVGDKPGSPSETPESTAKWPANLEEGSKFLYEMKLSNQGDYVMIIPVKNPSLPVAWQDGAFNDRETGLFRNSKGEPFLKISASKGLHYYKYSVDPNTHLGTWTAEGTAINHGGKSKDMPKVSFWNANWE